MKNLIWLWIALVVIVAGLLTAGALYLSLAPR